jgi:hypothetical protein
MHDLRLALCEAPLNETGLEGLTAPRLEVGTPGAWGEQGDALTDRERENGQDE